MSAPWVNGTVEGVLDYLREAYASAGDRRDTGLIYASAIGMITGLANGYTPERTTEQNMADIRTVVTAVDQLQQLLQQERNS